MNDIKEKINLINKISEYLTARSHYSRESLPITSNYKLRKFFEERDCDGSSFTIKDNKLIFSSWLESHHNGDSYNHEKKEIDLTEEICDLILKDLNTQYEQHEFARIEKLEEEKRIENIRQQIVSAKERFKL